MNFGDALVLLKNGSSVKRSSWSEPGKILYLDKGATGLSDKEIASLTGLENVDELFDMCGPDVGTRFPNFVVSTLIYIDDKATRVSTTWNFLPVDILASDWVLVKK